MTHKLYFYVNLGWRRQYCGIEELVYEGITFYFVDNEYYFGRPYVYGLGGDEGERFAYFDRAVLEALPHIGFKPDVLHCHDWQTGMIPVLLKSQYQTLDFYRGIKTLYTVHNLQYQGVFSIDYIEDLLSLGAWAYTSDNIEFYGGASFMKGGLRFSDYISTVSPTYALEIQSSYYGERLDGLLRSRGNRLVGILNGIDTDEYNPATDPLIYANYSLRAPSKKKENKTALQEELGLKVDPTVPLLGMVGRLSSQKGLELVEDVDNRGNVVDYESGPVEPTYDNFYMDVLIIRREMLAHLVDQAVAHGERDFGKDIIQSHIRTGDMKIMGYEYKGYACRIESVLSLFRFNMDMLDVKTRHEMFNVNPVYTKVRDEVPAKYMHDSSAVNSLVADGCVIEGHIENSILFRGVRVAPGATVKNSIIMQDSEIQQGAEVENVILDKQVTIKRDGRLIGQPSYPIVIAKGSIL